MGRLAILLLLACWLGVVPVAQAHDVAVPGTAERVESPWVDYPRPTVAFGLHDTPILGGSQDVRQAVRDWRSLGVGLVTVLDPRDDLLVEAQRAGIQVVARVYSPSIYETGNLVGITERVVARGMRYVVPYNEPNLRSECAGNWPDPVDFAARWIEAAETIHEHGGYPVLTPLAPEGDYPNLLYFEQMLSEVVGLRGVQWLLDLRVAVGVHAYIMRPGESFFDQFGTYAEILENETGLVLPMLATEGGIAPGAPTVEGWSRVEELIAIAEALREGRLPEYVLGASLWLYSNSAQGGRDRRFEASAWYGPDGPREVAQAISEEVAAESLPWRGIPLAGRYRAE